MEPKPTPAQPPPAPKASVGAGVKIAPPPEPAPAPKASVGAGVKTELKPVPASKPEVKAGPGTGKPAPSTPAPSSTTPAGITYSKQTTAEPAKAPEPTSRTNRGTPEKQATSDKIAERNRTTGSLAKEHISNGETSSRVLSMSPAERTAFMEKHGLKTNADYLAYVHNPTKARGWGE